jgi:hypothetical protein
MRSARKISAVSAEERRLAELDAALARLRGQYDMLMNAFEFEEASLLAPAIEATERERKTLASALPAEPPPVPYTVSRRRRRRR